MRTVWRLVCSSKSSWRRQTFQTTTRTSRTTGRSLRRISKTIINKISTLLQEKERSQRRSHHQVLLTSPVMQSPRSWSYQGVSISKTILTTWLHSRRKRSRGTQRCTLLALLKPKNSETLKAFYQERTTLTLTPREDSTRWYREITWTIALKCFRR